MFQQLSRNVTTKTEHLGDARLVSYRFQFEVPHLQVCSGAPMQDASRHEERSFQTENGIKGRSGPIP